MWNEKEPGVDLSDFQPNAFKITSNGKVLNMTSNEKVLNIKVVRL